MIKTSTLKTARLPRALLLATCLLGSAASPATAGDSTAEKPLLLEVRYCDCTLATPVDQADTVPLLRTEAVIHQDQSITTDYLSLHYRLSPVDTGQEAYRFSYSGAYDRGETSLSAQSKIQLTPGEWVILFATHHEPDAGGHPVSVAARIRSATHIKH